MKLTITGDAYALTSDIKVSDIELLKKCNPEALIIRDKEGVEIFGVSYVEGKPSVAKFGITFDSKSRGEKEGYAMVTGTISPKLSTAEAKVFVAEMFGGVVDHLKELEKSVPEAAKTVTEKRKKIIDDISVS